MNNSNNNEFSYITLGTLSKMTGIGRDTLAFYYKKGLLKPAYIGRNGYKYYLPEHVNRIRFIRFCRFLDFSLEEISDMLENNENDTFAPSYGLKILEARHEILKNRLNRYRHAVDFLENELNFCRMLERHTDEDVYFKKEDAMYFLPAAFSIDENLIYRINSNVDDESSPTRHINTLPDLPMACVLNTEKLKEGIFEEIVISEEEQPMQRSADTFATITHTNGSVPLKESTYRLLARIEEEGLEITGNTYVISSHLFMNVMNPENQRLIIQVPVTDPAEK